MIIEILNYKNKIATTAVTITRFSQSNRYSVLLYRIVLLCIASRCVAL